MSDTNLSRLNTVLLLVMLVLVVWGLFRKPSGRFQPISASHDFVLDTATGRICSPAPDAWRDTWRKVDVQEETERQARHAAFIRDPKEVDLEDRMPSCSELK